MFRLPSLPGRCIVTRAAPGSVSSTSLGVHRRPTPRALLNTVNWTLIAPIAATLVGLVYALVIDKIRGEAFAKALVFLPNAISFVGAAVIWDLMYKQPSQNAPSGLLNVFLQLVRRWGRSTSRRHPYDDATG